MDAVAAGRKLYAISSRGSRIWGLPPAAAVCAAASCWGVNTTNLYLIVWLPAVACIISQYFQIAYWKCVWQMLGADCIH